MFKKADQKERRSRRTWLDAALSMVAETGIGGLKVQELAASLGATTGSLYWHFKDRRSLVLALVEHWARMSTEPIAEAIEHSDAPPGERLLKLMSLVLENIATSGDIAVRSWAAHDPEAAEVVRRVDHRRAEVVSGLFRELGFHDDEATMRTQLLLCYESCERFVVSGLSEEEKRNLLRIRHQLYCRR